VSQKFAWLMKAAAHAVERFVKARDPRALSSDCLEVLRKFRAVREWTGDFSDIKIEFGTLVPEWQGLNDESFWHDIAATRRATDQKSGERLTDYWQAQ